MTQRTFARADHHWEETSRASGRPELVVLDDPDELAAAAKERGLSDHVEALLRHHAEGTEPGTRTPRLRGHVDRTPDGEIVLSAPTVSYVEESRDVHTGMLTVVVGTDIVLLAEVGEAHVIPHSLDKLCSGVPLPDEGPRQVLAAVLLTLVSRAADVEAGLGDAVAETERTVFTSRLDVGVVERIYDLKREISEARRALGPMATVLPALQGETEEPTGGTNRATQAWLRRVQTTADRVDRHLDAHDKLLDAMLSVHLTQVSVRQNEDMRKISAWAAIAAVPTLIAGIYGMNFHHMPELTWSFGYPLALAGMAAVCVVLYRAFRRSGWL